MNDTDTDTDTDNNKFQVGDIVRWCGVGGKITSIDDLATYPIGVKFEDPNRIDSFTSDGRYADWHKAPSLELIERPKKRVKKWVNLYNANLEENMWMFHDTKVLADERQMTSRNRLACIEVEFNEEDLKEC